MLLYNDRHFTRDIREIVDALGRESLNVQRDRTSSADADIEKDRTNASNDFIDVSRTVLELGHPASASIFLGLATDQDGLVEDDCVTVIGRSFSELPPGRYSLAMILLAKAAHVTETVRRDLNKYILTCNRIGGVMVRMASGRIWFRFNREALADGLTLNAVGRHIIEQMKADGHRYEAAEVIFMVADRKQVERLRPVAEKREQDRNDRFRAALVDKMACETGLDCDDCPENEVCNVLKEAVAIARKEAV